MQTHARTFAVAALALVIACGDPSGAGGGGPIVTLHSPVPGTRFSGGDVIEVRASATDAAGAPLAGVEFSWWADLHHDTHTHPFRPAAEGAQGQATIPRVGHLETNIFYRFYARALDAEGRADTAYVDMEPRLTVLNITTEPAQLVVLVDGQPRATPLALPSVVGMEHTVGVPPEQNHGPFAYAFARWAHGGPATQRVTSPDEPLALTVSLEAIGPANIMPTVQFTSPASGAHVRTGVPVPLTATASDADGSIVRVDFLDDTQVIGTATTEPWAVLWTPTTLGQRRLRAQATDTRYGSTLSDEVRVVVQGAGAGDITAPVATLTAPAPGSTGLTGSVLATATATDDIGVSSVEFELDGILAGIDAEAPYDVLIASTAAHASGAHVVRARARDAAGNVSPWASAPVTFGGDVALPAGFTRTPFVEGFNGILTAIAFAPDGRMFVAEQTGQLRVVKNGVLLAEPFVALTVNADGERGLLGVALDPSFAANGYVYVYHTTPEGGLHNRVTRFTASGDVAAAGSAQVIVDLPTLSAAANHNGGAMQFGPDGKLYVAVGDNTNGAQAPSLERVFGKILRFNADGTIPADNPFYTQTAGLNRAIWAKGLRNPYTFGFQPGTGRMHINDVGENEWEEINLGRAGADYGWPATEGPTTDVRYDAPLLAYRHSGGPPLFNGYSVVGAAFYNPSTPMFGTPYVGDYFFADYVSGWVYRMESDGSNDAYAFAQTGENPVNLIVGADGSLYVLLNSRIDRITR